MPPPACCTSDDTDLHMYVLLPYIGRETGRLQYATAKACVRGESRLFLKRDGCGWDS